MTGLEIAAIMAAVGLGKSMLIDAPQQRKQAALQAATAKYSPWTGLQPQNVAPVDWLGPALQGGIQGYALGQQEQNLEFQKTTAQAALERARAETEYINRLGGGMPASPTSPSLMPWGTPAMANKSSMVPKLQGPSMMETPYGFAPYKDPSVYTPSPWLQDYQRRLATR